MLTELDYVVIVLCWYSKMGCVICNFIKYRTLVLVVIVLWSGQAVCEDDAYMRALEAEVSSQVGDNAGLEKKQPLTLQQIQKKEFEEKLSSELPTTYRTYRMLSFDDKNKVVKTYVSNGENMKKATRLLFELYYK